ncbi:MAG: hypothetical protein COZ09_10145 [Comamonadaceae bacterium CG_4_10_14_3_um_filter_60_42]|nr:MAG: hypothetical protein COZ09_10145 [Comamonadaceae bacterium CG_4_10_14_3_um_filter_60_42]
MNDFRIEGTEELNRALGKLSKDAEKYVSDAVNATGLELRGDIVKRYQRGSKTGIIYAKVNPTRTHQASAPGEAPATDTGRLVSATVFSRIGRLAAEVENKVLYGAMLEWGTRNIAPRPAWRPAAEEIRPKFIKRLENALKRAMR